MLALLVYVLEGHHKERQEDSDFSWRWRACFDRNQSVNPKKKRSFASPLMASINHLSTIVPCRYYRIR